MLAPAAGARSYSRGVLRFLLLGLALLTPGPALAQLAVHPMPPGPRPFHERLAESDVAAVVLVEQVGEGRIEVRCEDALMGAPPERFEVKRSPLSPPPLATGDRALLLLRGDRAPYVFADAPSEVIRLSDPAMATRWREAARAVIARRDDPAALVPIYRDWMSGGPETLREIGRSGLLDLARKHAELREEIAQELEHRE